MTFNGVTNERMDFSPYGKTTRNFDENNSRKRIKLNDCDDFTVERVIKTIEDSKFLLLSEQNIKYDPIELAEEAISVTRRSYTDSKLVLKKIIEGSDKLDIPTFIATIHLCITSDNRIDVPDWLAYGGKPLLARVASYAINNQMEHFDNAVLLINNLISKNNGCEILINYFNCYGDDFNTHSIALCENYAHYSDLLKVSTKEEMDSLFDLISSNQTATYLLRSSQYSCEVKRKFLQSALCHVNFEGSWKKLFHSENSLTTAMDFVAKHGLESKYLSCLAIDASAFEKLISLLDNPHALSVYKNGIFENIDSIERFTTFIKESSQQQIETLSKLVILYPNNVTLLCQLITEPYLMFFNDGWEKYLFNKNKNTLDFLELAEKVLEHSRKNISDVVNFITNKHWCEKLLPCIKLVPVDSLETFLVNFNSIYHKLTPRQFNYICNHPQYLVIFSTIGTITSSTFDKLRFANVVESIIGNPFPVAELAAFLKHFSRDQDQQILLAESIGYLIRYKKDELIIALTKFPFPPETTIKQLLMLLSQTPAKTSLVPQLLAKFPNIKFSLLKMMDISEYAVRTNASESFLRHASLLIGQNYDKLALNLFRYLFHSPEAASYAQAMAYLAIKRDRPDLVERLCQYFEKDNPDFASFQLFFYAVREFSKNDAEKLFQLEKLSKKDPLANNLLTRAFKEFASTRSIPKELMTLINAFFASRTSECLTLLDLFPIGFVTNNPVEQCILEFLRQGEYRVAKEVESRKTEVARLLPTSLSRVKLFLKSGVIDITEEQDFRHFKSKLDSLTLRRRVYQSSEITRTEASMQMFIQEWVNLWSDNGVVDLELASQALMDDRIKKSMSKESYSSLLIQLTKFENTASLREKIEDLTFTADQNGQFAFLIRSTLGLQRADTINDGHLVKFALITLFSLSRQPEKVGSCVGVSLYNSMVQRKSEELIAYIQELGKHDKVVNQLRHYSRDIYLSMFPDENELNSQISITSWLPSKVNNVPLEELPAVQRLINYFGVNPDDVPDLLYNTMVELQTQNLAKPPLSINFVVITHKMFIEAFVSNLPPNLGNFNVDLRQAELIYLHDFIPLHTRILEALLITLDPTFIKLADKMLIQIYKDNILPALASQIALGKDEEDKLLERFTKKIHKKLTIVFDQQKGGIQKLIDVDNLTDYRSDLIDSPKKFGSYINYIVDLTLKNISSRYFDDIHRELNKLDFEKISREKIESMHGKKYAEKNAPWKFSPGAHTRETLKKTLKIKSLEIETKGLHCQQPEDLLQFILENLDRHQEDGIVVGDIPEHAVNFVFNHPNLMKISSSTERKAYIEKTFIVPAQQMHRSMTMTRVEYLSLLAKIEEKLPEELKLSFKEKCLKNPSQARYVVAEIVNQLKDILVNIHGNNNVIVDKYSFIDELTLDKWSADLSDLVIPVIDMNWGDNKNESIYLGLFYNPLSLRWEVWKVNFNGKLNAREESFLKGEKEHKIFSLVG